MTTLAITTPKAIATLHKARRAGAARTSEISGDSVCCRDRRFQRKPKKDRIATMMTTAPTM
jgi:hypothetical protein